MIKHLGRLDKEEIKMHDNTNTPQVAWNVVDKKKFQKVLSETFDEITNVLSTTLGPFGSTTFIETHEDFHVTKDGWNILKRIHFNHPTYDNIAQLFLKIASNIVRRVGDGSTTSIMAAHSLFREISQYVETHKDTNIRQSELISITNNVADKIISRLHKSSKKVTSYDDIRRIAYISTNGDEEVSSMIADIYEKTDNSTIEFVSGGGLETTYEIVEGYRSKINLTDSIYVTEADGTCVINNPKIIMFDHNVSEDSHYKFFLEDLMLESVQKSQPLLVIAPTFNKPMLEIFRRVAYNQTKAGVPITVFSAYSTLINKDQHQRYGDLSAILGANIVRSIDVEQVNKVHFERDENGDLQKHAVPHDVKVSDFIGSVGKVTLGTTSSASFQNFINKNDELFEVQRKDALDRLRDIEEKAVKYDTYDIDLDKAKRRLSSIRGKMGIIHVGGESQLQRTINYDAIEDAVKAADSTYRTGYNLGGSFAIPLAVDHLIETEEFEEGVEKDMAIVIKNAFLTVFGRILSNREGDKAYDNLLDSALEIYPQVKDTNKCYNIITDEFDGDVINSSETDIEVLRGALSIVTLLISSSQYVSTRPITQLDY